MANMVDNIDVEGEIVDAIHRQELAAFCDQLIVTTPFMSAAAREQVQAARRTCARIARENADIDAEVREALAAAGVTVAQVNDLSRGTEKLYHRVDIAIPRNQAARAFKVAEDIGFAMPCLLSPAQLSAWVANADNATLTRLNGIIHARLGVALLPKLSAGMGRRFRPTLSDIRAVALPPALSFGYWALRPARVMIERITGQRAPGADIDFLGTPAPLIPPLFDIIGLNSRDVLLDVGSGDGRILITAAESRGCRAIGVEANLDLTRSSRATAAKSSAADRIEILHGDASAAPFSRASVVFLFLPSFLLTRILPQILGVLDRSTRVIAHEQLPLKAVPEPDRSVPVISENAVTVAHVWHGKAND